MNILIFLIFFLSIIYTIKYRFMQLHFIPESKAALKNKSSKITFLMSLGAHIGAGNIIGVTTALIYGGPGAIFWMVVCTIFTTIFSLIENTLAIKFRSKIDGENRGGSCYYILGGLSSRTLAMVFCIFLVLTSTIFFGSIQINAVSETLVYLFSLKKIYIFILILIFSFIVIFRGTKTIVGFIQKIVPLMTLLYFAFSLIVLLYNYKFLDNIIILIIKDAFSLKPGLVGIIVVGFKRSLFSNEAGLGTSPSINAMSDIKQPLKQGYLQVFTCFIDTVLMCSMLGIIILIYNPDLTKFTGADLSIYLFEIILGEFGKYIGGFFLFSFALATIVSGYYAGESNILFLKHNNGFQSKKLKLIYKILFIVGIIIGVFLPIRAIWNLVDYGLVILGVVNIYVLIRLENVFKSECQKTFY